MKNTFSLVCTYKLVLSEPTNSQNEENKQFLHVLCSPPTSKMALLLAVQIQLLSLRNQRSHFHRQASSALVIGDILQGGVHPRGEVW